MILAIDLGSTSFKAGVFNTDLDCIGSGSADLKYCYAPGGVVELNPEHVADSVRQAVAAALEEVDPSSLKAVAMTSQAQTFTITDSSFKPLIPFISWLDTRATAAAGKLRKNQALSGFPLHASFPEILAGLQLSKLRHLRDERPELLNGWSQVVSLPSYMTALLSGTHVCDRNLAAMSGLYSMQSSAWWNKALEACGVHEASLPQLVDTGTVAARTTKEALVFGLPEDIPIVLAGNDQTAGAYGAGVKEEMAMLITLGTCQVAYCYTNKRPAEDRTVATGPWPGGGWYLLAAEQHGGSLINWAETVIVGCDTDERFFAVAESAPAGCNGLRFKVDEEGKGHCWSGMTSAHVPADFARSVLEELVRHMASLVHELVGAALPEKIFIAGGGSNSAFWMGLVGKALDRDLIRTEASPLTGAARMAKEALG